MHQTSTWGDINAATKTWPAALLTSTSGLGQAQLTLQAPLASTCRAPPPHASTGLPYLGVHSYLRPGLRFLSFPGGGAAQSPSCPSTTSLPFGAIQLHPPPLAQFPSLPSTLLAFLHELLIASVYCPFRTFPSNQPHPSPFNLVIGASKTPERKCTARHNCDMRALRDCHLAEGVPVTILIISTP
jgi:hypothetical protein